MRAAAKAEAAAANAEKLAAQAAAARETGEEVVVERAARLAAAKAIEAEEALEETTASINSGSKTAPVALTSAQLQADSLSTVCLYP